MSAILSREFSTDIRMAASAADRDGTAALNTPLPNTKTITVTVTWQQRGPRSFEVTYMKADNL